MKAITFSWNGWVYVQGKISYWKERHNPKFKNNREKEIISIDEYTEMAGKWAAIFL